MQGNTVAVTVMWVAAVNSPVLPLTSFANDAWLFCQKFSKLELVVQQSCTIFSIVSSILGPSWFDTLDMYHFSHLPVGFNWRVYCMICGFFLLYMTVLGGVKRIFVWYAQHHYNMILPQTASK